MPDQPHELTLTVAGARIERPEVPALLRAGATRRGGVVDDPLLPDDFLTVVHAVDLSPAARDAAGGRDEERLAVRPEQLVVLELPDGTTFITSGERFLRDVERVAPEAVKDGTVSLDGVLPRGAQSRGITETLGKLVSRLFVLDQRRLSDAVIDEALERLRKTAGDALADKVRDGARWGIHYLAVRALLWAVERRLPTETGLYRWNAGTIDADGLRRDGDPRLADDARRGRLLVFVHGTGSHTRGAFSDLRTLDEQVQHDWDALVERYQDRIYGFEHRTLSESPIENALQLARALPDGAQVDFVTHSRGGLVGDLLALDWSDAGQVQELIDGYRRFRSRDNKDARDLDEADRKDREDLQALAAVLRHKRLEVQRYVRVASPSNGTLLAGANLDLFLSGLLTVLGAVTTLQASPFYIAFKRAVLEIVRNRADATRIPGLEAMLPGSALARFLRLAEPRPAVTLGVIAGDIQRASRFKRLVELLADWAIFERQQNDLVVDTPSMDAGIASAAGGRRILLQGALVDHVSYFSNPPSRAAMAQWLTSPDVGSLKEFTPIAGRFVDQAPAAPTGRAARGARRGGEQLPVVVVLPGIMGTHLKVGTKRVWFDPLALARGELDALSNMAPEAVSPDAIFEMFYGKLCARLEQGHRVVRFAYDWRRPLQVAADALAQELATVLEETREAGLPVRILAHSMGGLVTRVMAATHAPIWTELLNRDGARFIMLGTPNQGSHQMVATLLGKGDMVRKLAMLDLEHGLQGVLDIVKEFPGALQLLPRPGFLDVGETPIADYLAKDVFKGFQPKVTDFWFGDGIVGVPSDDARAVAAPMWSLPGLADATLTAPGKGRVIYVCGKADNTPCGLTVDDRRVRLLGTAEGDGTVTWKSGEIRGIDAAYLMPASHGDLASTREHFDALVELLDRGTTDKLPSGWPSAVRRDGAAAAAIEYDVGPATVPTDDELARAILGAQGGESGDVPPEQGGPSVLRVGCAAMDLRYANAPILVGHYEQDPIAGAEAIIDRDVVSNELSWRNHLGLYPGAIGTATVVLVDENDEELARSTRRGAIVTGLGQYGALTVASLTEAVRVAALRYLLTEVERQGGVGSEAAGDEAPRGLAMSSLLLGHNSTANIGVADAVSALVRGVLEANRQFARSERTGRRLRIDRLLIVEQYIDVAISAARALRAAAAGFTEDASDIGMRVEAERELVTGEGWRPRLEVQAAMGYWPRLSVTGEDDQGRAATTEGNAAQVQRARVATILKYTYLGARARAEQVQDVQQPGFVETLVAMSLRNPAYDKELAQTLFQLLIPLDFKEVARQTDSLILVLDEFTANVPWELLAVDGQPLVKRTKLVRQFASTEWRRRVRSTVGKQVYVVGNPSTRGFAPHYRGVRGGAQGELPNLPGAEKEAFAVLEVMRGAGYDPTDVIGSTHDAPAVINGLFRHPYRIIHIAAHGEFAVEHVDGRQRSGVVLSDGLMLTAAEIGKMEVVPDVVFLNCCHLGVVDGQPKRRDVAYNRLAGSVARELIQMGVRAVLVAGWAVDDMAGQRFAERFYHYLLASGMQFGDAVHLARQDVIRDFGSTNTWGAYQAYGDPSFTMDPSRDRSSGRTRGRDLVDPQELIDHLNGVRQRLRYPGGRGRSQTIRAIEREVDGLFERCPEGWRSRGDVQVQLGMLYAECGDDGFTRAVECFSAALAREERGERVPVKAIEQLANLEGRLGGAQPRRAQVKRATQRLEALVRAVASDAGKPSGALTSERYALLGSAYKRMAAAVPGKQCVAFLKTAREWYRRGMGGDNDLPLHALSAINVALLDALLEPSPSDTAVARRVAREARGRFAQTRDYWDALVPADARLAEAMGSGALNTPAAKDAKTARELTALATAYRQARGSVIEVGKSYNSVLVQLQLLARFAKALRREGLATNLEQLARLIDGATG